jgi:hypothetical protein
MAAGEQARGRALLAARAATDRRDMLRSLSKAGLVAAACVLAAGCDLLNKATEKTSPTSPTPAVSLDAFAGTWTSKTASTPATGCGSVKYTVAPVGASSANVSFAATCASNIQVTGSGTGKVNGAALEWSAQGAVSQGGLTCPFTFTNGKATEDTATTLKVTYSGTVCGIPVSGTEVVTR